MCHTSHLHSGLIKCTHLPLTAIPVFTLRFSSLYPYSDFIAAVREVAFDAANNKLLFQSADAAAALTVSLNGTSPPPPVVTGVGTFGT